MNNVVAKRVPPGDRWNLIGEEGDVVVYDSLTECLNQIFKVHQVTSYLKQRKAEHHFWNIKGKGVNLWSLPAFAKQENGHDVPKDVEDDKEEVPF